MRVFKNRSFARFARKARITNADLCAAIVDASRGLIDADLCRPHLVCIHLRWVSSIGLARFRANPIVALATQGCLGGGVLKQRIARQGSGKSGGLRTIILFRIGERAFFVHGFAKNERDNIRDDEVAAFKLLAAEMLAYDDESLAGAIGNGTLTEVVCN